MKAPSRHTFTLLAVPLLLTACGTTHAGPTPATMPRTSHSSTPSPDPGLTPAAHTAPTMSPGMSMAPGTTMDPGTSMAPGMSMPAAKARTPAEAAADAPLPAATMVCGPETRRNVATLLGLRTQPTPRHQWRDHLYTCTTPCPTAR